MVCVWPAAREARDGRREEQASRVDWWRHSRSRVDSALFSYLRALQGTDMVNINCHDEITISNSLSPSYLSLSVGLISARKSVLIIRILTTRACLCLFFALTPERFLIKKAKLSNTMWRLTAKWVNRILYLTHLATFLYFISYCVCPHVSANYVKKNQTVKISLHLPKKPSSQASVLEKPPRINEWGFSRATHRIS